MLRTESLVKLPSRMTRELADRALEIRLRSDCSNTETLIVRLYHLYATTGLKATDAAQLHAKVARSDIRNAVSDTAAQGCA